MKELIAFTNSDVNKDINSTSFSIVFSKDTAGAANGYVAVPSDHPFYGKDYTDIDVNVHGGLTFSSSGEDVLMYFTEINIIRGNIDNLKDYWVFGFDTCHFKDDLDSWPIERVEEETLNLLKQLEEVYE